MNELAFTDYQRVLAERDEARRLLAEAVALLRRYRGGNYVQELYDNIDPYTDAFLSRLPKGR